jgi:phosphoribosyl 1,2-cyclic phosphate phosphodiesterase
MSAIKSMLYFNDSGIVGHDVDDFLRDMGAKIDFVSFDCTKGDMDYKYNSHMSLAECTSMKERFLEAGICGSFTRFIVTHFSHNCRYTHAELEQAARKYGFTAAYDGLEIEI